MNQHPASPPTGHTAETITQSAHHAFRQVAPPQVFDEGRGANRSCQRPRSQTAEIPEDARPANGVAGMPPGSVGEGLGQSYFLRQAEVRGGDFVEVNAAGPGVWGEGRGGYEGGPDQLSLVICFIVLGFFFSWSQPMAQSANVAQTVGLLCRGLEIRRPQRRLRVPGAGSNGPDKERTGETETQKVPPGVTGQGG